jgi:hypothetical protein
VTPEFSHESAADRYRKVFCRGFVPQCRSEGLPNRPHLETMQPSRAQNPVRRRKDDLVNLRSLATREPATGTGKVMWIWPEIEASLATGKKLREIWDAIRADSLDIPYPQFRVYVSRIRNRQSRRRELETATTPRAAAAESSAEPQPQSPTPPPDPFSNLREQREKKQSDGFTYDPFSVQKQLID